ncbi:MAG: radical SAM family heme chaperone HemW [Gammaproteobacteria bacterium]
MFNFTALPPLSLYVHMPWCVRKCPYCDFNSHETKDALPEAEYIAALIADLEQELPSVWGRSIESIFIGGGTPSLFSPAAFDRLFSEIRARLPCKPGIEITMEANPGTWEYGKFREFRAVGVNRLSLGIQSFDTEMLQKLGRIHGAREAFTAAETAHAVGFDNFNLDLMFGLPGQSIAQALADIRNAIALQPAHISLYQLTLEPNTAFYVNPPALPEDDALWEMQEQCQSRLATHGYRQYEVSAYAQPGHECRHNLNYWRFGDYLGIGAGAHGKISDAQHQRITRSWKVKNPRDYLAKAATPARIGGTQALKRNDVGLEFMMNALRLTDGFPVALFAEHTGQPISIVKQGLQQAEEKGLIEWDIHTIRPTELGRRFLNDLLGLFLGE